MKNLHKARYLLILMAFFAIFCGLIYNDFMSIPLDLFGSCFKNIKKPKKDCVYTFGLDPVWGIATNKLTFTNSLKMKLSVILGVTQMVVGVLLKGLNCVHFGNKVDLFFEFIPQLLFMICTFGYLCVMIFIKWATDFSKNTRLAPSLLNTFLNMGLKLGSTEGSDLYKSPD